MNLFLVLRRNARAAHQNLPALASDLHRVPQIGSQPVQRRNHLQFFDNIRWVNRLSRSFNSIRRHARLTGHAAGGFSHCACGKCWLICQFRHLHPLPVAKLEPPFQRFEVRHPELEGCRDKFARIRGCLDAVTVAVRRLCVLDGRDLVPLRRELVAPCFKSLCTQRVVPVVIRRAEKPLDRRRFGCRLARANDARQLLRSGPDADAPRGPRPRIRHRHRFLQQRGRLHRRSLAQLIHDGADHRHRDGPGGRPPHSRTRRENGSGQARRQRFAVERCVYPIETPGQVPPGFGRRRQAGPQNVLAVAHTIGDRVLQLFQRGSAMPAGFQVLADLPRIPPRQFAIEIAQQLPLFRMPHSQATHSAPSSAAPWPGAGTLPRWKR